jgi:photosystem II stability/assembly factor-like uncharacterized protein
VSHLFQLIPLLLAICAPGQQETGPHTERLKYSARDVVFCCANNAWVLTMNYEIVKTTDAGRTWEIIAGDEVGRPWRITFLNTTVGWGVDNDGWVRSTSDGGRSWRLLSNVVPDGARGVIGPVNGVAFVDELNGWILTPFTLRRTTDGGASWRDERLDASFSLLRFVNKRDGWIADEDHFLYRTTDGGDTWHRRAGPRPYGDASDISFATDLNGWVGTLSGLFNTTDGGESWARQTIPGGDSRVTSIQFLNKREGWATVMDFKPQEPNRNGLWFKAMLLHTSDGGMNWTVTDTVNDDEWHHKVYFSDARHGWLYTDTGLHRSEDGGRSWNVVLQYPRPDHRID